MSKKKPPTKKHSKIKTKANPMWGGHYTIAPTKMMEQINASIDFDKKLYSQDIDGSLAHVKMLSDQKIVTKKEAQHITTGLNKIRKEIAADTFTFKASLEDIHMNIEHRLSELIGDTAGKLHTARSRNDQVATDFRLYVRDQLDGLDMHLKELQHSLINKAEEHYDTITPGMTHLQNAQCVTFGHHLLAYVEMFGRDRKRISDARTRLNESPLGAAALAGTAFPIDRKKTAKALGFDKPMANSMDAVSDRDFALEFLFIASTTVMHLSRLAEEFIIWSSKQFNFVTLSEQYTTGSSIMPQKRNPDAAELIRGKTGRIFGNLLSLLTVMKGLPLTYNKDSQEDKEPVFDSAETIGLCVRVMNGMIDNMVVHKDTMLKAASQGYVTATDLADWLVKHIGIPFRKAHHVTGKIVRLAEKRQCALHELSLDQLQKIEPNINKAIYNALSVQASVTSKKSFGGTSPINVKRAIIKAREQYL